MDICLSNVLCRQVEETKPNEYTLNFLFKRKPKLCGVYRVCMYFNGDFFGKGLRKNDIKTVDKSAAAHEFGLITRTARKPEMIKNLQ